MSITAMTNRDVDMYQRSEDFDSDQDSDEWDDATAGANDETNPMEAFLSDPELSMKVFFSSYFRERGLIWYISTSLFVIAVMLIHYLFDSGQSYVALTHPFWCPSSYATSSAAASSLSPSTIVL